MFQNYKLTLPMRCTFLLFGLMGKHARIIRATPPLPTPRRSPQLTCIVSVEEFPYLCLAQKYGDVQHIAISIEIDQLLNRVFRFGYVQKGVLIWILPR